MPPSIRRRWRRWLRSRELRLGSGLVLAVFVVGHLGGHALGIVSIEAMEAARRVQAVLWQSLPGTLALYGAIVIHLALGLRALYRRHTLRMPLWEALQLGFGLAIPLLLAGHVVGTRGAQELLGFDVNYPYVLSLLWDGAWPATKQVLGLVLVWLHVCIGLHFWLRLKPGYRRSGLLPVVLAVALPLLSLAGYVAAGLDQRRAEAADPSRMEAARAGLGAAPAADLDRLKLLLSLAPWGVAALYGLALGARQLRLLRAARSGTYRVRHSTGRTVSARHGQSVLETLRFARVPHASVCGGRARCTTCRIRVGAGLAALPEPEGLEAAALARIAAPPNVRLACQLRPRTDLDVTPLLPADAGVGSPGGVQGREQQVVAMFVDLRGSTALGERKLPYDVVFVLNRFFEEMSAALMDTGGHYAQFSGDGLMALYGLDESQPAGCRSAVRGAIEMTRRLDALNEQLEGEIDAPMRIGIGVHAGEAIVGTMGPPSSPNFSAVGDNINIAARLEQQTKPLGCTLVISAEAARQAGLDLDGFPEHQLPVRGREAPVQAFGIEDPAALEAQLREAGG